ncbi:MAG: GDP-mannose 4,6-dehydratase, partial [Chloroflexi bacterium]|nr:GDP-mannose 4,6-dehydratase [Chloroflexota bacterium]
MKQKRVVITGGAGFIGSNLAKELDRGGYNVIILDNLSTGKNANIKPILKKGRVEFHQGSITDFPLLQKLFRDIDFVLHLAAIPRVPLSIENPQASHDVNMTGTLN